MTPLSQTAASILAEAIAIALKKTDQSVADASSLSLSDRQTRVAQDYFRRLEGDYINARTELQRLRARLLADAYTPPEREPV